MSFKNLTTIQTTILDFIEKSIKETGVPPSIKEICKHSGLSSSSSVHHQLVALEKKGFITRDKTKSRCIKITARKKKTQPQSINVQTYVNPKNCDYPLVIFDQQLNPVCTDIWSLPLAMTGTKDAFLFRMESFELEDRGIYPKDILIIEYKENPPDGDTVMVVADGKIMFRTLQIEQDFFILLPQSARFFAAKFKELTFIGTLRGILRQTSNYQESLK